MSKKPMTVAFVSGKGGVGKTALAANFAWVCSQIAKTVIVDLDFQNQGCTGLFAPHIRFGECNAMDALVNTGDGFLGDINLVAKDLYFLPAVSWKKRGQRETIIPSITNEDFPGRLEVLLEGLKQSHGAEIVILDCHGGVDLVSLSAFQTAHHTLMVTEADSVTFAGTLELLDYYESETLRSESKSSSSTEHGSGAERQLKNVRFVMNRLPTKYKWEDLEKIYRAHISKGLGTFTSDESIFCYIPHVDWLADSFGEYPFNVELAPRTIFAKKICFMVRSLLPESLEPDVDPRHQGIAKIFRKLKRERYSRKIERTVVSDQARNRAHIVNLFLWFSAAVWLLLIAFVPYYLYVETIDYTDQVDTYLYIVLAIVGCAVLPLFWYFTRASFGIMFLFRDRYHYQKKMFKCINPRLTVWQRLSIAKLFVLRIATSVLPILIILYALLICFSFVFGFISELIS